MDYNGNYDTGDFYDIGSNMVMYIFADSFFKCLRFLKNETSKSSFIRQTSISADSIFIEWSSVTILQNWEICCLDNFSSLIPWYTILSLLITVVCFVSFKIL